MLQAVPTEQLQFQPHAKSMTLARLAHHVAELASWPAFVLTAPELNFAAFDYKPVFPTTNEELMATFEKSYQEGLAALENAQDEVMMEQWTLRNGDHIILQQPRIVVLRGMCFNHMVHHRGQLSVYLRLLDVAIPGMYGPSADEMEAMAAAAAQN
jgi:uncharacterized damage-inducible protein DinB